MNLVTQTVWELPSIHHAMKSDHLVVQSRQYDSLINETRCGRGREVLYLVLHMFYERTGYISRYIYSIYKKNITYHSTRSSVTQTCSKDRRQHNFFQRTGCLVVVEIHTLQINKGLLIVFPVIFCWTHFLLNKSKHRNDNLSAKY